MRGRVLIETISAQADDRPKNWGKSLMSKEYPREWAGTPALNQPHPPRPIGCSAESPMKTARSISLPRVTCGAKFAPLGGSWGTTATCEVSGRKICRDCAVKELGIGDLPCTIDSVAHLPPDIHEGLLGLDRKGREAEYQRAADQAWEVPPGYARLTEEEKRGQLFISHFYPENPI
jgi:hypothetical protein